MFYRETLQLAHIKQGQGETRFFFQTEKTDKSMLILLIINHIFERPHVLKDIS